MIKLATLGDLLLVTPAVRALCRRYSNARPDVLTTPEAAPLLADSPSVDRVNSMDLHPIERNWDINRRVRAVGDLVNLLMQLRRTNYDVALLAHQLTLPEHLANTALC